MPDFKAYVRAHLPPLGLPGAREAEIAEELALELEEHYATALNAGLSPEDAWRHVTNRMPAWHELGPELQRALRSAPASACEPRGRTNMFTIVREDIRSAFRMLRKNPAFTTAVVLVTALGIGPNTAMFSAIYSVFLAPAPWAGKGEMVVLWSKTNNSGMMRGTVDSVDRARVHVSPRDYEEWRSQTSSFQAFGASLPKMATLNDDSERPVRLATESLTPGLLTMLRERLQLGRDFLPAEGIRGNPCVAILSDRLWRQRFGGDVRSLGRRIRLDGEACTVVGVRAPAANGGQPEQLWSALVVKADEAIQDDRILTVVALLKPGVPMARAQAEMDAVSARLARRYPRSDAGWSVKIEPYLNDWLIPRARTNLWLLMGAVTLLLLIACVNVANLLLARAVVRGKEIAVRASLGAARWQLFRQMLTESLVLFAFGGAVGVALGWVILKTFLAILPQGSVPSASPIDLSIPSLLFTGAATLLSGLIFGCIPAWRAASVDIGERLKRGGGSGQTRSHRRFAKTLVVAEFALTLTLLAAAGLALRTFWNRTHLDLGIRTDRILTFEVPPRRDRFQNSVQIELFYRNLLGKIGAVPGVTRASAVNVGLLEQTGRLPFTLVGQPANAPLWAGFRVVTPRFFETFGARVVRGRAFTDRDRLNDPLVAMVNEKFAGRFLAGRDPTGQNLTLPVLAPGRQFQIVGVFHDIQNAPQFGDENQPEMCVAFGQVPLRYMTLAVRTAGDPDAMTGSIAAAVHSFDPEMPMANVMTADRIVRERLGFDRFEAVLYGAFAALALLLAVAGIYSVMACIVSQRTREAGLRIALGAGRSGIVRLVLREGMTLAFTGLVLGLGCAWSAGRLMEARLYGAGAAQDPATVAAAAAVLLGGGAVACLIPANRAARVDPMTALRDE